MGWLIAIALLVASCKPCIKSEPQTVCRPAVIYYIWIGKVMVPQFIPAGCDVEDVCVLRGK